MRTVLSGILTVTLFMGYAASTFAQGTPPVSGATLIAAFSETVHIGDDDPNIGPGVIKDIDVEFEIWLTSGNETIMSFDVESMEFDTPCEWAETFSLEILMNEVAKDGLVAAVSLGHITSSPTCPAATLTKVYYPTCVKRDLTGPCPALIPATGSSFSYNSYSVCTVASITTVTLVSQSCGATSCGSGFELTCN